MVKQTLLHLVRFLGREWQGQHRRRAIQTEIQQVEQLESRQLLTNTVTETYATPGGIHQLTIELTNPSPQDLTVDPNDGSVAQFHVEILGPDGITGDPPASHSSPRVELGAEDVDLNGALDVGEDVVNANLQPIPDGILQATVLGFENLTLLPLETGATRRKFVGDFSVDLGANRTVTLPIVVRRSLGNTAGRLVDTITVTTDTIGPTMTSVSNITTPRSTSVSTVTVTFDSEITASSFTADDVTLLRDNMPITPTPILTIMSAGGNSFTIGSLADDTTTDGDYTLTISAAGVTDLPGNFGSGSVARTWTKTTPSSPTLATADDSGRETDDGITNQLTDLTFNGSADGAAMVQVRLTLNGGGITTSNAVLNGSSYTAEFAGPLAEGTYTVEALITAGDGTTTVSSPAASLTLDATAPAQLTALDLTSASDTEGSHIFVDDNLTNDITPTFTFSGAEPDAAVTLLRDAVSMTPEIPASGETVASVTATTTTAGIHQFAAFQTDLAGNVGATSANLAVAVDTTQPTVASLKLPAAITLPTNLKVTITNSNSPTVDFKLTDQFFSGFTNTTEVKLIERLADSSLSTLSTSTTVITNNSAKDLSLTPDNPLSSGQHSVFVRATDAAGNVSDSSDFNFFINQPGAATLGAPATPVFSETYFLGSKLLQAVTGGNTLLVDREIPAGLTLRGSSTTGSTFTAVVQSVAPSGDNFVLTLTANLTVSIAQNALLTWLRPWNMSFDRTTQTIWFTNEDGHRLGQFDPATGGVTLYDISIGGSTTATDPHGVIFDLDTHLTPRVWMVFRNTSDSDTPTPPDNEPGRVTYLDLAEKELLTFDFTGLLKPDGTSRLAEQLHATFIDARGHLWISSEDSGELLELDFDQQLDGTLNPSINSRTGRIIAHELPEELGDVIGGSAFEVEPHGMAPVVDERTGEQYVYFSDGDNASSGRAYLLKVGRPANSIPVGQPGHDPGTADRWIDFNVDEALISEGRLVTNALGVTTASGHSLFLALDDNETPGIPEDDHLLIADPGNNGTAGGVIRRFDVRDVIRALQDNPATPDLPPTTLTETVRIPKIPGADSSQTFSRPQLPFTDREGNTFFVDAQGSVGRFHFDDPGVNVSTINAPVLSFTTTPVAYAIPLTALTAPMTTLTLTAEEVGAAGTEDRSQADGIDQYEVARSSSRNRTDGAFRGTINAGNVLYGSLAQSDYVSTTVFAETSRRQMAVVADPTPLPLGAIVEGRLAFQVARNGSLIMTSREPGQLLDQQINLSRELGLTTTDANKLIDGDASAVARPNGDVHVFGKNQIGGLVEYRGILGNDGNRTWTATALPAPATNVLAGEPTAFIDEQNRVSALLNDSAGNLLLYRNNGDAPFDLTSLAVGAKPLVFASVDVVEDPGTDTLFVYGSDQTGAIVEYRFNTTNNVPSVVMGVPLAVTLTTAAASQLPRDVEIFQSLSAVRMTDGTRHIFGTDGHSRLVHLKVTGTGTAEGENVTELTRATATGYFNSADPDVNSFQRGFEARVHPELSVLVDSADDNVYVYGTNALDLVEFTLSGTTWTAANLTNDVLKGTGTSRIPANKVFGAPGTYVTPGGDRHVFQINADGDVIEYSIRNASDHFNTQNINLARGNTYTSLQDLNVTVAPTLSIPVVPLDVTAGGPAVLVATDASVSADPDANFNTWNLIVRTINGATNDGVRIRPQTFADGGSITVALAVVSFNTVAFGSFTGGTGDAPLVITFNGASTQDALEALLRSLEFSTPVTSAIGVRFVDFVLTDNTGRQSNRVAQQVTVDDADASTNPLNNPLL